ELGNSSNKAAFEPFYKMREELERPLRDRALLWPRQSGRNGDLISDEMGERVLQVPGWTNIPTSPIQNRVDMLSTGVRTPIGVKVFGLDLDTITQVCKQVE